MVTGAGVARVGGGGSPALFTTPVSRWPGSLSVVPLSVRALVFRLEAGMSRQSSLDETRIDMPLLHEYDIPARWDENNILLGGTHRCTDRPPISPTPAPHFFFFLFFFSSLARSAR
jgi:hypothetical protein